jgi:hypothetical protein
VEAVPQTYYTEDLGGMTFYVPNGFVVLRDPELNTTKMVKEILYRNLSAMCWGMITSLSNFDYST